MKKYLFFPLVLCIICNVNSQTSTYKIINKPSVIEATNPSGAMKKLSETDGYSTIDWYNFQLLKGNLEALETEHTNLFAKLEANSKAPIEKRLTDDAKKAIEDRIKANELETRKINIKRDSLYHNYIIDYLQYRRFNIFMGKEKSSAFFDILYNLQGDRFKVLTNTGLSFGNNTGSIYSELVSGNLGIFRVGIGAMLSSSSLKDSTKSVKEEAYQRLVTTGGNTVINIEYPLIYWHSRNYQYNLISRLLVKGAVDLPQFGTSTKDFAGNGSVGIDVYADASLSNNAGRLFANIHVSEISGSETFKQNLQTTTPDFSFGQLTMGVVFNGNIKISVIIATFSSQKVLENRSAVVGGQFVR